MTIINQLQEFAPDATPENILTPEAYEAEPKRLTGHVPGLADQKLENAALRQVSRFCRGVAEFIALRHAPGVVDDGDKAKIVAGLEAAIAAMIEEQAVTVVPATTTDAGIVELATNAEAITGTDAVRAITAAALAAAIAANIGVSLQAYDAATALTNAAQGWTRQQRPVPVLRTGATGNQAVDCDLHQLLGITSTAAITMLDATNLAEGAEVTLMFTSASQQTISWAASWKGNAIIAKPTVTIAGKWTTAYFVCQCNPSTGLLEMVLVGVVYGV